MKSGVSGLLRRPLSPTTIYEKGFFGNRLSVRKTRLFSEGQDGTGSIILLYVVVISVAVLCSEPDP